MDARVDHRLAWIIAAALAGSAACSSNGAEPSGSGSATGGRDGGTRDLSACLAPSWFGSTADMSASGPQKDDCRTNLVERACGAKTASKGPQARPVAQAKKSPANRSDSCKGVFTVRSDAEIDSILAAIDDGQLAQAKLAADHASSPAVKELAAKMIDGHTKNQDRRRNLPNRAPAQKAPVQQTPSRRAPTQKAPPPNGTPAGGGEIASSLNKGFADAAKALADLHGDDFDREFLAREVVQHRHTVELLEQLAPQAKAGNVHTAVDDARALEVTHEKMGCDAWADVVAKTPGKSQVQADDSSDEMSDDACEAEPE